MKADVVVVGAGPAGSAAAAVLARAGAVVVIADRAVFPRDKICGDGLLPDATGALGGVGALDAVQAVAHPVDGIVFRSPSGKEGTVPVRGLVTPRRVLDALLLEQAQEAGAELLGGVRLESFAGEPGRFRAARFSRDGGDVEVEADHVVLATGAAPRPRLLAGLRGGGRRGAAVRGYARISGRDEGSLVIHFDGMRCRGYMWAFPVGGERWNIGCGVFSGVSGVALVPAAAAFARRMGAAEWEERPHGAPLFAAFPHLTVARGNVLAVGDAAGLTRPFSGEGIGPALSSGELAARCLLSADGGVAGRYTAALRSSFAADFRAWRLGETLLRLSPLVNVMVARVERSRRARARVKSVLSSRERTGSVLSVAGLLRILLGR